MRFLGVHPGPLLYTKVFLRLEPLGLELVAAAARHNGHQVRLIDLQVEDHRAYFRTIERWRPDIVAFSCNYLANVPEIVDLAKATKARFPGIFICVGGHSASFTAGAIIAHGEGAIDCVLKGEGEAAMPLLLAAIEAGRDPVTVPGAVTAAGEGPPPGFVHSLDDLTPARDLLASSPQIFHRHSRPLRLDRVLARLPVGLLVLQRLDLLRPQLSAGQHRAGRRGSALDTRARHFHRRRRRLYPRAPRARNRRGNRPRRHQEEVLPRNPRRRAVAQQGGVSAVGAARAGHDVSRPRGDRRGGAARSTASG